MTLRRLLSFAVPVLLAISAGAAAGARARDVFPHRKHERVFPVCQGCHAGIASGVTADVFPAPADCARCHDGRRERRVDYSPPAPRASNLRFSHVRHFAITDSARETTRCQTCHAADSSGRRMSVAGPQPGLCIQCHEHRAESHQAQGALCNTCHVPLAVATALDSSTIARFPRPAWHGDSNFVIRHGALARSSTMSCAVCHARESCERCHANAERVPPIVSLARDARVARLVAGRVPVYPVPSSHDAGDWRSTHGVAAHTTGASCANCHTQASCITCHESPGASSGPVIASLAAARPGGAPGVSPALIRRDVHPDDIVQKHGAMAAAGKPQCTECHQTRWCAQCHQAQDSKAFHPANFAERHAADAFSRSGDCQTCHRTETFCRSCHSRVGIASNGRMTGAFHTSQGSWVLSHGQAARRGLETCAACHAQSDCLRCHSASSGWGVNPHGPGFSASRTSSASSASCRVCHTTVPQNGK